MPAQTDCALDLHAAYQAQTALDFDAVICWRAGLEFAVRLRGARGDRLQREHWRRSLLAQRPWSAAVPARACAALKAKPERRISGCCVQDA